jgi:hypothetical protein
MRRILYLPIALIAYWALAQNAPAPLASLFPAGAMVYLEARDFSALVRDWDASAEKAAWLQSANYAAFSRSRLFLKLGEARKEFASAAGVPVDYAMAGAVAGRESAIAVYQIGDLEFLYVTRLGASRTIDTVLWKARGSYQSRRAGGIDYFVKEDAATHRVAAFAVSGDMLLLASKEELIAGTLELMARAQRPAVAAEKWFQDATAAAGPAGELRLVYNLERLESAPHFRSYWIQRNASALKEFSAGVTDLDRARSEIRERRILLREKAAPAVTEESPAGQLLAMVPDDAGFYRVRMNPGDEAPRAIRYRFFSVAGGGVVASGGGDELETRIDVEPLVRDAVEVKLSGRVDAMLEVARSEVSGELVGTRSAVALIGDGLALEAPDLVVVNRGRFLIAGDSQALVDAVAARIGRAPAVGVAYAATWRHSRELANFEKMMRLIDFPQIPAGVDEREPMFFSENVASLGRVLRRVESASMEVHDAGSALRESVVYRIAP